MSKKSPVKTKPAPVIKPLTVSRAEAAAMLGFNIQTIDSLISAKKLRASKIGRRVVIRSASIEAMLDATVVQS
jgi:excisionase family DNA binding protein